MRITFLLTPWCRVLEKLTGLQLVKKFPAFCGTRKFITALTSVRHLSLSCASPIQSTYPHPTSWRSILILSTHQRLGLPSGLFPSGFPTKTLYAPPLLTHTRHMPSPYVHSPKKENMQHEMETQQPWKSLPQYIYLHMHTCMNTLCGILNSLAQNITYTIHGNVTHKMPNVICSYAAPLNSRLLHLIQGSRG